MRLILVISGLVIAFLVGWWLFEYLASREGGFIQLTVPKSILESAKEKTQEIKSSGEAANKKLTAVGEDLASTTKGFLADIQEQVGLDEIKKLPEAIQNKEIKISTGGIEITQSPNVLPLTIGLTAKINQKLSFVIAAANEKASFDVDWGDEEKLGGKLKAQEEKILDHSWGKTGDYVVIIKTQSESANKSVYFPIKVLP